MVKGIAPKPKPKPKRSENADTLSKVRKRFQRAANRFRRAGSGLTERGQAFLESIATRLEKQAQQFTMKNLRNQYSDEKINDVVKQIENDSEFALLSFDAESRQEKLGKVLLQDKDIASRFYAGTIELWRGKTGDARDAAIKDFFGVDTLYDAMEKLSELTGEDLMALDSADAEMYARFKDAIRVQVSSRIALG